MSKSEGHARLRLEQIWQAFKVDKVADLMCSKSIDTMYLVSEWTESGSDPRDCM